MFKFVCRNSDKHEDRAASNDSKDKYSKREEKRTVIEFDRDTKKDRKDDKEFEEKSKRTSDQKVSKTF